jgi:hypothetical protein
MPQALYNYKPTFPTSRILGKCAAFAAVAAFWFSRFVVVNPVAFFKLIVGFLFLIRAMSG